MNKGIYRLVFNETRGIWMVVDESARGHQVGKNSSRLIKRKEQRSLSEFFILLIGITTSMLGMMTFTTAAMAESAANAAINTPNVNLNVTSGTVYHTATTNNLNIRQTTPKAILNGTKFNIPTGNTVDFNHTAAGNANSTLIRINGPKSVIQGALNSNNGAIHLINQNGVLFANGAQVNVNGLVASALDIDDADYLDDLGQLKPFIDGSRPAYVWKGDAEGKNVDDNTTVLVEIEPSASIKAKLGSGVMLLAPKVVNHGNIETNEGQVVMAAGKKVYLSVAPDLNNGSGTATNKTYTYQKESSLRGLAGVLVEVDSFDNAVDAQGKPTGITGVVENAQTGNILARKQNITMAGLMVNQKGSVVATTTVNQKGSIRLLARDTMVRDSGRAIEVENLDGSDDPNNLDSVADRLSDISALTNNNLITGSRTGELTVDVNSVTAVIPETPEAQTVVDEHLSAKPVMHAKVTAAIHERSNASAASKLNDNPDDDIDVETASSETPFNPSTIEFAAKKIVIEDGAKVVAPAGHISITAKNNDAVFNNDSTPNDARVYVGKNVDISTAGLKDVSLEIERNFVERLLTFTDLQDNPVNREVDKFLYRANVFFDIRNTPDARVANLAGFIAQVPQTVAEKSTIGGSVNIRSEGDIILRETATVDVSGGSLAYQTGVNKETWLVDQAGNQYALGNAPVDVEFTGFLNDKNTYDRQEEGYSEGKAAGSVNIQAYDLVINADLKGEASYGKHQLKVAKLGGELTVEALTPLTPSELTNFNINGGNQPLGDVATHEVVLTAARREETVIDGNMLNRSGFDDMKLSASGDAKINQALNLEKGANFSLTALDVQVNQSVQATGGSINLKSIYNPTLNGDSGDLNTATTRNVTVADNVTLDVSGAFVNHTNGADEERYILDGGSVSLDAAEQVVLNNGSHIDVSAGIRTFTENVARKTEAGNAGAITIETNRIDSTAEAGQNGTTRPFKYIAPVLNGTFSGYGIATADGVSNGGHLSITAPFVTIAQTGFGGGNELHIAPEFFKSGGFEAFSLTGRDGVIVRQNTVVDVIAKQRVLNRNYYIQNSGTSVANFSTVTEVHPVYRKSTGLSLSTQQVTEGVNASAAYTESGVTRGSVVIEEGASIRVDAQGANGINGQSPYINLAAWNNELYMNGLLSALGGSVQLKMHGQVADSQYNEKQVIWLDDQANISTAGYTKLKLNGLGLNEGEVIDGGTITLDADKGYIVAKAGAKLDVSGAQANLDVVYDNTVSNENIASNAGVINIEAREGMLLDNDFLATSPSGLNGELNITLSRGSNDIRNAAESSTYPGSPVNISRTQPGYLSDLQWYVSVKQDQGGSAAGLTFGESIENAAVGLAKLSANKLTQFDSLNLRSEYGVRFEGDVSLNPSRALRINAQVVEGGALANANINTALFSIGNYERSLDSAIRTQITSFGTVTPVQGDASLTVNAKQVNFDGNLALSKFKTTTFNSDYDLRFSGFSIGRTADNVISPPSGTLNVQGDLTLNARQIFPTTLTDYTINVSGDNNQISFNKVQADSQYDQVFSALGKLTVNANNINQNGILLAPFGNIALNAANEGSLNLNTGSVTSVSADGSIIPFGFTAEDGAAYRYNYGGAILTLAELPESSIKLNGADVNFNENSRVKINGGGDLFAYEWIPGIGGSSDVLANNANQYIFGEGTVDTWAILPQSSNIYPHYDIQYWAGNQLKAGDAVYLSGMDGLSDGYYALLPARYALLPNAMLVSEVTGYQDFTDGAAALIESGATLVSGHKASYTTNGYRQTSRRAAFSVRQGSDAYKLAEYKTTTASDFFVEKGVRSPLDSGVLSFSASSNLVLKGIIDALAVQGGKGAKINIGAPNLLVVRDEDADGQVSLDGVDYLAIKASNLNSFKAASLLLGGDRSNGNLSVVSSNVRLNDDAQLTGPEILLAASDTVKLDQGATLSGQGDGGTNESYIIEDISGDGDVAFVSVSGQNNAALSDAVNRNNSNADKGDVVIEAGATLAAEGALYVDASKNADLDGNITFNAGADIGFRAGRVSLGAPENGVAVTDGLWLKKTALDQYATAGSLLLKSNSTVDLYGDSSFGNEQLNLTINAAGVTGYQNDNTNTIITANQVIINNNDNASIIGVNTLSDGSSPALGAGSIAITANAIEVGDNDFNMAGFTNTNLKANTVKFTGSATQNNLNVDRDLTIESAKVTTSKLANHGVTVAGQLTLEGMQGEAADLSTASSLGATLALTGQTVLVTDGAVVDMRTGTTNIHANGIADSDGVTLNNGATILGNGVSFSIFDEIVDLPAGAVNITADAGDVNIENAAIKLDAASDSNAGVLTIAAVGGNVSLNGNITANSANASGKASIDANTISNTIQAFKTLEGFTGQQHYRIRQGDVVTDVTDVITAQDVNLTADNGGVTLNGTIDASGEKGGSVAVYAMNDVTLSDGAKIVANAFGVKDSTAGSIGNGGSVILATQAGQIITADASGTTLIDVGGSDQGAVAGENGEVIFRAKRADSNTDGADDSVNIDTTAAAVVSGADKVILEAFKSYQLNTIGETQTAIFKADNNAYIADVASAMSSYTTSKDGRAVTIMPSIDVISDGDITLTDDWIIGHENYTFIFSRPGLPVFGPNPQFLVEGGSFNLRAAGNVNINGNINYEQYSAPDDQFINLILNDYQVYPNSWNIRLVAGADQRSSNIEAVVQGVGDITLGTDKFVRTGTGFIHAVAGNDVKLGAGAALYTEGVPLLSSEAPVDFESVGGPIVTEYALQNGGNVSIVAGNNITGDVNTAYNNNGDSTLSTDNWHNQTGIQGELVNKQFRWWTGFNHFANGVATMGGGDLNVTAGNALSHIQIASASSGRMGGPVDVAPDRQHFQEYGGGDVNVTANSQVDNVLLHAGKGELNVSTTGEINDLQLSLIDANVNVDAAEGINIGSITNPTAVNGTILNNDNSRFSQTVTKFYSLTADTSVDVRSAAGNVNVDGNEEVVAPIVKLAAPNGDISLQDATLYPSSIGNLTLLAGNDITKLANVVLSDVDPNNITTVDKSNPADIGNLPLNAYIGAEAHVITGNALHQDDTNPVKAFALNNIHFLDKNALAGTDVAPLITPKKTIIKAGNDIIDPNIIIQNNNASDVSSFSAGNDIYYRQPRTITVTINGAPVETVRPIQSSLTVTGQGRLNIEAGKDVDLGVSKGILSKGNVYNQNLPEIGADIYVQAGAKGVRDHQQFIQDYLAPGAQYSDLYLPELNQYMTGRTGETLTDAQALAQFSLLDTADQIAFINAVFYQEIIAGGRGAIGTAPSNFELNDYSRSQRAILSLFPEFTTNTTLAQQSGSIHDDFNAIANETPIFGGDIKIFNSQIKSERGGRIEMMTPFGGVFGGLAVATNIEKPDADQGVLSLRGGELYGFVRNNFAVNTSRVFTLGGSDLMLFSALGDLDAGKGAKTASATPPPVLRLVNGQVTYDYSAAVSGSGIGAFTSTGGEPGVVDLFAPFGVIDAGEAGIRVEGNLNIGAQTIVGADNISVGGSSTVPAPSVGGLGAVAPLPADATGAGSQDDALSDAANKSAEGDQDKSPSLITVEVLSLGDDDEKEG